MTGDYYLRARNYTAQTGRFTQEDTHWNPVNMIYGDEMNYRNNGELKTAIPDNLAIFQSSNLYNYCMGNPIKWVDVNGEIAVITFVLIAAVAGAIIGAATGAAISYHKYKEVKWQYVTAGAVIGCGIGALGGYAIATIGVSASGAISTGIYTSLNKGVNFTKTTLDRMTNPDRFVPVSLLIETIKNGAEKADPQGTAFKMYTMAMTRNGKAYTLEVLYDKATNTIMHFVYK